MHPQTRAERIAAAQRHASRLAWLESVGSAPVAPRAPVNDARTPYPFHRGASLDQLRAAALLLS